MGGEGLFSGPAPRVFTTPATAAFLEVLADAMADALSRRDQPFALADAVVLLPNRRAARGLMDAFAARLGGAALAPTLRPLADLDDDPDVWGAEPLAFDISPAIDPLQRRMELAALVRARESAAGGVDDPVRALAFADALCALLDGAAAADGVDWTRLGDLVTDAGLAEHWRQSAAFLEIIATYWPQRLAAEGLMDPAARRNAVLDALAAQWTAHPPSRPIVIAGSTGSIAATRRLMAVAARLPMGAVVLPGLDQDLDAAAWGSVGPQHPQHALRETLAALELDRAAVRRLGGDAAPGPRALLIREALAPAETTADWLTRLHDAGGAPVVRAGLDGLMLVEAETEDEEAAVCAIALRQALETPGATAALVTPSASVARRVSAKLARWGLSPTTSIGLPLIETPAGSLLGLLITLSGDDGDPVALAGLLKHPLCDGFDADAVAAFEHGHLRGPRRHGSLASLQARAKGLSEGVVVRLREGLAALSGEVERLDAFAQALAAAVETLAGDRAWTGADGEAAAALLSGLMTHGAAIGAMRADQAQRATLALLAARESAPDGGGSSRIAILGPLEARLQRRSLMVLAGLNEGAWPEPPREDAFLSRGMRASLGLPSPDVRVGLAAHDFAQMACGPNVLLTRAKRKDGAPTVASRWVWRLATLARGAAGAAMETEASRALLGLARTMDAPRIYRPASAPTPRPPATHRLTRLSVTDVELLIRDPYALFAKRILGLKALASVGAAPGPAERGTAIHAALQAFDALPAEERTPQALTELLRSGLAGAGFGRAEVAADGARLALAARRYCSWLEERAGRLKASYLEVRGLLPLTGEIVLSGQADRIDLWRGGGAEIVDVKSGIPPSEKVVASGLSPQLPLEAAMLARGAFETAPAMAVTALSYWRFGGRDPKPCILELDGDAAKAGEEALERLQQLLARYAEPGQPFLCKPRAQFANARADYDLLARRQEWAHAGDEE